MFCDTLPLQLLSKNHLFLIFWNGVDLPPSFSDNVFKYTVFFLEYPLRIMASHCMVDHIYYQEGAQFITLIHNHWYKSLENARYHHSLQSIHNIRAIGLGSVQQRKEHHSPIRLPPEHPLLTKEGETVVEGHHHPTEHVLQHPAELHHHLQLDMEREEKKRQNLKYLKMKSQLWVAQINYLPQNHRATV